VPQISEHCPEYSPKRLEERNVWFNRPGNASTLTPIEGIVQAWITSIEEINMRVVDLIGMEILSLVFSNRYVLDFSIKHSISFSLKLGYS